MGDFIRRSFGSTLAAAACLWGLTALSGCGPPVQQYVQVDNLLSRQQYAEADAVIVKYKPGYGERNAVLYYFDRGMMLHLAGQYAESNRFLAQAEDRIDQLYTKSVTGEGGAMLTNDNALPYEGEDFEKVMINVIAALNYVYLGQWDDALVEARKVDHKLDLFNDAYEKKNVYKRDALAQYLSGILYEAKGEVNDAFISYRKAYEAYGDYRKNYATPMPPPLPADLLRTSAALGFTEEHQDYLRQFPDTRWITEKELQSRSELIFISYTGRSPVKEDTFITAPVPDGRGGTYILRVALPKFVPLPDRVRTAEVHLVPEDGAAASGGAVSGRAFLAEDITAIAKKNLEDRIGRITAKAIARATAKYLASRTIRNEFSKGQGGESLAGFLADVGTNIYSVATEQSDKRSWRTLPGEIQMARVAVPPGTYTVAVEYYDSAGGLIERKAFPGTTLKAGEKRFVGYRILGR
ncbi:MAG TPA: hypothetical protein VMN77_03870 [Nitrospiria bacterium]|jgi:hypothetical protein|nr:hypothetical protein [Nitrospiria bacterium]